jgi:hypothetical protein
VTLQLLLLVPVGAGARLYTDAVLDMLGGFPTPTHVPAPARGPRLRGRAGDGTPGREAARLDTVGSSSDA